VIRADPGCRQHSGAKRGEPAGAARPALGEQEGRLRETRGWAITGESRSRKGAGNAPDIPPGENLMNAQPLLRRCSWAKSEMGLAYHDREWGVPVHDDRGLFEFLILEGAQAGLSWETILKKRQNYRQAMDRFDAEKIARYDRRKIASLLADPGIIRNRLKIESAVTNAQAALKVREGFGSLDAYFWRFVEGQARVNRWRVPSRVPAKTHESDTLSLDLRQRCFRFVGSTICYAFMQAVGMVNDHLVSCFRHPQL